MDVDPFWILFRSLLDLDLSFPRCFVGSFPVVCWFFLNVVPLKVFDRSFSRREILSGYCSIISRRFDRSFLFVCSNLPGCFTELFWMFVLFFQDVGSFLFVPFDPLFNLFAQSQSFQRCFVDPFQKFCSVLSGCLLNLILDVWIILKNIDPFHNIHWILFKCGSFRCVCWFLEFAHCSILAMKNCSFLFRMFVRSFQWMWILFRMFVQSFLKMLVGYFLDVCLLALWMWILSGYFGSFLDVSRCFHNVCSIFSGYRSYPGCLLDPFKIWMLFHFCTLVGLFYVDHLKMFACSILSVCYCDPFCRTFVCSYPSLLDPSVSARFDPFKISSIWSGTVQSFVWPFLCVCLNFLDLFNPYLLYPFKCIHSCCWLSYMTVDSSLG